MGRDTQRHTLYVSLLTGLLYLGPGAQRIQEEKRGRGRGRAEEAPILPLLSTMEHLDQYTCPPLVAGVPAKFTQIERMAYADI